MNQIQDKEKTFKNKITKTKHKIHENHTRDMKTNSR